MCPSPNEAPQQAPLPLHLFDYTLPAERIAQAPMVPRDHSRLMVLAGTRQPQHRRFFDVPSELQAGDLLVVNRTRVIPARLHTRKMTGGAVELLMVEPVHGPIETAPQWRAMARPAKGLKPNDSLTTLQGARLRVVGRDGADVLVEAQGPMLDLLTTEGRIPLPPYLDRSREPTAADAAAYQTMFAQEPGAVAAPTASLHFTPELEAALKAQGVLFADVLLHVGPGTFLPVRPEHADDVHQHAMHSEHYVVPEATQQAVAQARARGRRVVAVGTTSLRALETWANTRQSEGASKLFITPGYRFAAVNALITNFHLPKSTLLMLVSALMGRERMLEAYATAIAHGYRFFSFGDAMLIKDTLAAPSTEGAPEGA